MKKNEFLMIGERVSAHVFRGDRGYYTTEPDETICVNDLITNAGRIHLAKRIAAGDTVSSAMLYTAIGTATTAPDLTDTTLTGEISRKLSTISSAQTNNIYSNVSTWGGAADSIQSIAITEAMVINHASSGNGDCFQRVTFAAVTLANSDIFRLTLETVVGSNTI